MLNRDTRKIRMKAELSAVSCNLTMTFEIDSIQVGTYGHAGFRVRRPFIVGQIAQHVLHKVLHIIRITVTRTLTVFINTAFPAVTVRTTQNAVVVRVTDNHQFALTDLPQRNKRQVKGGGIARNVFRLNERRRFRNVRQLVFIPGAFFAEGQPVVFIITRHQNRECRVGDIHHCLTARITGAAIEVGRVMEYMELADRFVVRIHTPQLVNNALNLAVINIACCQREPTLRVAAPKGVTNRRINLFSLPGFKLLKKFVCPLKGLIAFAQRLAIG